MPTSQSKTSKNARKKELGERWKEEKRRLKEKKPDNRPKTHAAQKVENYETLSSGEHSEDVQVSLAVSSKMEHNIDRISQLPQCIIHYLLSFLECPKTLVRMGLSSKDWFALTASFPVLKFHYDCVEDSRDMFSKYIYDTMSRFCEQKDINAHTFDIRMLALQPDEVYILDKCLGLLLKRGLKVLVINIYPGQDRPMYCVPNILLSASSLTSLTIHGCKFPLTLISNVIKFTSLKLLSLHSVPIDEGVIWCLTSSCPLLEEINLDNCYGFKRFCVSGLPKLKKVQIYCKNEIEREFRFYCKNEIERVDIEAPNLCYLLLDNYEGKKVPDMNFSSCNKLTTFCYYGLLSKGCTDFLSNIPFIENLFLRLPSHCDHLTLSSHSLRRLELQSNCGLENIDINTPKLLLFEYHLLPWSSSFLGKDPMHSKVCMTYDSCKLVDTCVFKKLRRFLDKHNEFEVLNFVFRANFIDVEKLKVLYSSPSTLDHVELVPASAHKLPVLVAVVDAVLWCWRPRSLTLILDGQITVFKEQSRIAKHTYEKLLQQESKWQITLRMVLSYYSGSKQHFSDLNLLLKALPHDYQRYTITFIKEEATLTRRSK